VLGRDDDACLHLGLGQAGHHADEVNHELAVAVRNHGEVGVFALGHGFGKLDVDGVGVWVLVGGLHIRVQILVAIHSILNELRRRQRTGLGQVRRGTRGT